MTRLSALFPAHHIAPAKPEGQPRNRRDVVGTYAVSFAAYAVGVIVVLTQLT
jgi:hypothetical protein